MPGCGEGGDEIFPALYRGEETYWQFTEPAVL